MIDPIQTKATNFWYSVHAERNFLNVVTLYRLPNQVMCATITQESSIMVYESAVADDNHNQVSNIYLRTSAGQNMRAGQLSLGISQKYVLRFSIIAELNRIML